MAITRVKTSSILQNFPKERSMLAGNDGDTGAYESIATVSVGAGGVATVSFTSIPSTFTHLQVRYLAATEGSAASDDPMYMRFNSDTNNSNYRSHRLGGSGSGTVADSYQLPICSAANGNGNASTYYAAGVIDILDYANTSKNKTVRGLSGWDSNGSGYAWFMSELWMNTAAITRIDLTLFSGGDYRENSHVALYGIR